MWGNIIKKGLRSFALAFGLDCPIMPIQGHLHLKNSLHSSQLQASSSPVLKIRIWPILWTLLNSLALSWFVCYWGFRPTFERHVLVELNETLVRAVGAGHKPQQHLSSVLQLAQIHLQKLKIMSSLVITDENLLSARYPISQSINQSINFVVAHYLQS